MANNFATLKLNQAVEKFTYVRIEPTRYVNDDLSSIGGGQYTITLSGFVISKVKENDTELTLVTSGLSSGEYTFDEDTGLLTVHPASAPSSTNAITVFYYLFYTSGSTPVLYQDPENTATTLRNWEQRIEISPPIQNSIKNILAGVLTISSSSLSIVNEEGALNQYFSVNDSWYNKEIKVWMCIDDTENIQKTFDGVVTKVSLNNEVITLRIEDPMSNLARPALLGDDTSETYITEDDYPNIDSKAANKPIPMIFGTLSRYGTRPETVTNLTTAAQVEPETLYEAYCVDYTTNLTTSNNREWLACRTVDGYLDFSCTPSNIDNTDPNFTRLDVTAAEAAKFHIGDTFIVDQSSTDYYVRCYYVDRTNNYVYVTKDATIATNDTVEAAEIPTVVVSNLRDETYYLLYGRDYSVTETATSGGNKIYKIVLANNFEANHAGLTTLDVGTHRVFYRMKPDTTNAKHGSVLKELLEAVGLTVNASSITSANSTLSSNVNFSIPQFDEPDYNPYYKYIELILKSTLGYIFLNNSFEIEYKLFVAPTSTDAITDSHILRDSFNIRLEYKDIITKIIAYNSHYSATEVTGLAATPSVTLSSTKAQYLHGIDNTTRFRHVLEDMSSRLTDIINFRSERVAYYNFQTATRNLDDLIGDDFQLEKTGLLGSDTERDVKLITTDKGTDRVVISAIDLIGL